MALTKKNQLLIAYKKLVGKAHTNSTYGDLNEALGSGVQLDNTTIFADPIPSSPNTALWSITDDIVEKVEFELEPITLSQYTANGSVAGGIEDNGDGAPNLGTTFYNGYHAYKLKLPSYYELNSSNTKAGTAPFVSNTSLPESNGSIQIVPPKYGSLYPVQISSSAGIINALDEENCYLDTFAGVLFVQDVNRVPTKVTGYIYIGKYQKDVVTNPAGSTGYLQYNNNGVFDASSNLFWDLANNRLGIGTAIPNYTLAVTGTLGVSGLATFTNDVVVSGQIKPTGLSTSWGVTSGTDTGGVNVTLGTSTGATWLISGTSNGTFRGGIQQLDAGNGARWYTNGNGQYAQLSSGGLSLAVGSYTGPLVNAITFNNGGAGVASGTTFDNSAARTISYNTIGAPSTTGTGASGTWNINITGSASRAASLGSYNTTTGLPEPTGTRTALSSGIYTYNATNISLGDSTPTAYWSVLGFGLSAIGGMGQLATTWSDNGTELYFRSLRDTADNWYAWKEILHSSNYNSYSPTLTGTGASGTWGINITGNAATATSAGTTTGTSTLRGPTSGFLLTPSDDTDTGLYDSGADTLGFYTANGERMRITSAGNVGIGTTNPIAPLHVDTPSNIRTLSLAPANRVAGNPSYILMGNSDSGGAAGPSMIVAANRNLQFGVGNSFNSNVGGTFTPYMTVDPNGSVGIGTTSPQSRLHVSGSSGLTVNTVGNVWAVFGADVTNSNYMAFRRPNSATSLGFLGGAGGGALTAGTSSDLAIRSEDSLYLATGGNNARMVINSAGNVGINTTSPGEWLDVRTTGASGEGARIGEAKIGTWEGGTAYAAFTHNSIHSTADSYALLQSNGGITYLNAAAGNPINFRINNADKMILDSAGNVGIGTTNPQAPLEVAAGSYNVRMGPKSWYGGTAYPTVYGSHPDGFVMLGVPHVPYLQNGVNGYTGNGLGAVVRFAGNTSAGSHWDAGIASNIGTDKFVIRRNDSAAPFLAIDNAGNVGIGTTSPQSRLHVSGSSGLTVNTVGNVWAVFGADVTNSNYMAFRRPNSATSLGFLGGAGGGALTAGTSSDLAIRSEDSLYLATGGNNARMVINSAGNVGIGTTSPTQGKLVIAAPDESTTSAISIRQSNSLTYGYDFALDQTVNGNGFLYAVDAETRREIMQWTRNPSPNLYLLNGGGNVGIGTTSPGEKLEVNGNIKFTSNGQGINFGAAAGAGSTSNLLDDYEEGTFTPTLYGSTTAGVSSVTRTGYYTKVGKLVHIAIRISVSSWSIAPSGNLTVGGLPFTTEAVGYPQFILYQGSGASDTTNVAANLNVSLGLSSGGTTGVIYKDGGDGNPAILVPANTSRLGTFYFAGVYRSNT